MSIRVIVPELLKEARGLRTRKSIVEAADKTFTEVAYYNWEEKGRQPRIKNQVSLCKALGVPFEKISLPIEKVPPDSKFFRH